MKAIEIDLPYDLDRDIFQDLFLEYLEPLGSIDDYGWKEEFYEGYENDVFYIKSYHWGGCTCGFQDPKEDWGDPEDHDWECLMYKPNFIYKPTNFMLSWYKYPLRGNECNQKITEIEFKKMMKHVMGSINV